MNPQGARTRLLASMVGGAVSLALASSPAVAQEIRGTVLLVDGQTPAAAVVVEASLVGGTARARALTGRGGSFVLSLPSAGSYRVTGLRIGYHPTSFGTVEVAQGETKPVRWVLTGSSLLLNAIRVDSAQLCGRDAENGRTVGSLVMQARAALAATMLTSPDGRSEAVWQTYRIVVDRANTPLTALRIASDSGATDRPFRTVGAHELATEGYVRPDPERIEYRSPDAEVLLSEQFMSSHCFRLGPSRTDALDWIGVAFTPARAPAPGRVDVTGVLWLDKRTAELRRLDFGYVGLSAAQDAAGAGGTVDYLRLETGIWLVNRWKLRMPRVSLVQHADQYVPMVNAVEVAGGNIEVVRRGENELYRSPYLVEELLPEATARVGMAPVCDVGPREERDHRGVMYGMLLGPDSTPVRRGTVKAEWRMPARSLGSRELFMESQVAVTDGFFMLCGLPVGRRFELEGTGDAGATPTLTLRIPSGKPFLTMDLTLQSPDTN